MSERDDELETTSANEPSEAADYRASIEAFYEALADPLATTAHAALVRKLGGNQPGTTRDLPVRAIAVHAWRMAKRLAHDDSDGRAMRAYVMTYVLDAAKVRGVYGDVIDTQDSMRELDRAFEKGLDDMIDACDMRGDPPADDAAALQEEAGILRWDELLARYLASIGETGRAAASGLRRRAAERAKEPADWRRWIEWRLPTDIDDGGAMFLVAASLWADRVGPAIQREMSTPLAMLQVAVHDTLFTATSRASPRRLSKEGAQLNLFDGPVIHVDVPFDDPPKFVADVLEFCYQGIQHLNTELALDIIIDLITTGHRQAIIEKRPNPHIYIIDGGYKAYVEKKLGRKGSKAQNTARQILWALRSLPFPLPGRKRGNLIVMREPDYSAVRRGTRGSLEIEISAPLMPYYQKTLPEGERNLVPLVPPPDLKGIGRDQESAALKVLWFLFLGQMRAKIKDLIGPNGEVIGLPLEATAADVREKAGVRKELLPRVLDAWTDPTRGTPPLDVISEADRRVVVADPRARAAFADAAAKAYGRKGRPKPPASKRQR